MRTPLEGQTGLDFTQLCQSVDQIKFKGSDGREEVFIPNDTLGFFEFQFSYGFPVYNAYQTALHPQVIALSYTSLKDQYLNYEHRMQVYDEKIDDRIIGHIVACSYPRNEGIGGKWKLTKADKTPFVTGVAAFYKKAQGLKRILGEHVTGRHKWTVSMEVDWALADAGFAVQRTAKADAEFKDSTPDDFSEAGWDYVSYVAAPKELAATFSEKKNRIVAQYKGRRVVLLMGGLGTPVHYAGLGLVKYGAEGPANIQRLVAAHPNHPLIEAMRELPKLMGQAMAAKLVKTNGGAQ